MSTSFFPTTDSPSPYRPSTKILVSTPFVFNDAYEGEKVVGERFSITGSSITEEGMTVFTTEDGGYIPASFLTEVSAEDVLAKLYVTARVCYNNEQVEHLASTTSCLVKGTSRVIHGIHFLPTDRGWIRCSDLLSMRIGA